MSYLNHLYGIDAFRRASQQSDLGNSDLIHTVINDLSDKVAAHIDRECHKIHSSYGEAAARMAAEIMLKSVTFSYYSDGKNEIAVSVLSPSGSADTGDSDEHF